ncbi:MAG: HAD hydrolase-like protein [Deltaproteobacteria bacterium]|nr:HAD hydrolase-like protein [Deltaproteobacteria bacterium]
MNVLLFDIDGTLVHSAGAGRVAFELAFARVHEIKNAGRDVAFDGKTDPAIYDEICAVMHIPPTRANRNEVLRRYALALARLMPVAPAAREIPGARDLLTVAKAAGHACGLLTGNIREGARIKLSRFGLLDFFCFGAYGDDAATREEIARLAIERGREAVDAPTLPPDRFVVIGDTPRDVECGRACGMRTLAVATGTRYTLDDLRSCSPDLAAGSLEDTQAIMSWIDSPARNRS